MRPGRHAFEARHPSWYCDDVADLLRERDVAFVVADDARPPARGAGTASWSYVRFHYGHRGRRGQLQPDASSTRGRGAIRGLRGDVLAYFNNDWEAFAPRNAEGVLSRLRG